MIFAMGRTKRQRWITALVLIACLLFQQLAMAAYACTMTQMPSDPVAMAQDCEMMAAEQVDQSTALCQKHCTPDPTSASSQNVLTVPALALPPLAYGLTHTQGVSRAAFAPDASFTRSDPPPRVRYCRMLI